MGIGEAIAAIIALVTTAVTIGVTVDQNQKAEKAMNEARAEKKLEAEQVNRQMIIGAMTQAAANSTALRIDKSVAESKLEWMKKTGNDGHYRLAREATREAREARIERNYGRPFMK